MLATALALIVLENEFEDKEDEWQMIAKKAKSFLKDNGIAKPDTLLSKFEFDFWHTWFKLKLKFI